MHATVIYTVSSCNCMCL